MRVTTNTISLVLGGVLSCFVASVSPVAANPAPEIQCLSPTYVTRRDTVFREYQATRQISFLIALRAIEPENAAERADRDGIAALLEIQSGDADIGIRHARDVPRIDCDKPIVGLIAARLVALDSLTTEESKQQKSIFYKELGASSDPSAPIFLALLLVGTAEHALKNGDSSSAFVMAEGAKQLLNTANVRNEKLRTVALTKIMFAAADDGKWREQANALEELMLLRADDPVDYAILAAHLAGILAEHSGCAAALPVYRAAVKHLLAMPTKVGSAISISSQVFFGDSLMRCGLRDQAWQILRNALSTVEAKMSMSDIWRGRILIKLAEIEIDRGNDANAAKLLTEAGIVVTMQERHPERGIATLQYELLVARSLRYRLRGAYAESASINRSLLSISESSQPGQRRAAYANWMLALKGAGSLRAALDSGRLAVATSAKQMRDRSADNDDYEKSLLTEVLSLSWSVYRQATRQHQ